MTTYEARKMNEKKHVAKMIATFVYYKTENNFAVSVDELLAELSSPRYVNHWEVSAQTQDEAMTLVVELAQALGFSMEVTKGRYWGVNEEHATTVSYYSFFEALSFLHKWVAGRLAMVIE